VLPGIDPDRRERLMSEQEPEAEVREQGLPTFHESAKKFKPGPVAPPESEADRADMRGTVPAAAAVAPAQPPTDDPAGGELSDGEPGQLRQMPGEEDG
jgi:hypothetical protein